ncbi:DNA-binding transcriptional regulator YhcF (GntR family) [Catenulispora sp. EB89]|uniref:GntR family transcriptional regulator n=1 Tax=Catenulispora sp. EB89 TaxID=3156257 RepID=UPI003512B6A9
MDTVAQVEENLRGWITDGSLLPGQQLPSERALVKRLGVGRNTVRLAIGRLIADGSVRTDHDQRYIVCDSCRADPPVRRFKVDSSEVVLQGPTFDLERRELSYSNGQQRQTYILRSPTTVLTAVLDADDRLLMVWRQRAWGSGSWELPSGIVKDGEDLAVAAARSTRALTGVRPKKLRHLMGYQPWADIADAREELFTAWAAAKTPIRTDLRNECVPDWIGLSELPGLIEDKKVVGGTSLIAALAVFVCRSSEIPKSLEWVKLFCAA